MRAVITDLLDAGREPEEVRAWFVARYGTRILLEPSMTGKTLLVWLLPIAALAVGAVSLYAMIRRQSRPGALVKSGASRPTDQGRNHASHVP